MEVLEDLVEEQVEIQELDKVEQVTHLQLVHLKVIQEEIQVLLMVDQLMEQEVEVELEQLVQLEQILLQVQEEQELLLQYQVHQ